MATNTVTIVSTYAIAHSHSVVSFIMWTSSIIIIPQIPGNVKYIKNIGPLQNVIDQFHYACKILSNSSRRSVSVS